MSGKARLDTLHDLGQSVWLDMISRELITSGRLAELVSIGVTGMTTNPSIFQKAIAGGEGYDDDLAALAARRLPPVEILDRLIVADVQAVADLLRPTYDKTGRRDGFVSIEVLPSLAGDTGRTESEARRLWRAVDRPNVMVKIPATAEGVPAIRRCLADGLNINITLMFSMADYEAVAEAFLSGLEDRLAAGGDVSGIASVASFFVSRVDTKADGLIDARLAAGASGEERTTLEWLRGRLGIANSKLVYDRFRQLFGGPRWAALAAAGAGVQRVLWASTSTKDPAYSDVLYADNLIGPDTIDTLPLETLEALLDHGVARRTVDEGLDEARAAFAAAQRLGIDMDAVTAELQREGVELFAVSYERLLARVDERRRALFGDQEGRESA
jgi:transaldolase